MSAAAIPQGPNFTATFCQRNKSSIPKIYIAFKIAQLAFFAFGISGYMSHNVFMIGSLSVLAVECLVIGAVGKQLLKASNKCVLLAMAVWTLITSTPTLSGCLGWSSVPNASFYYVIMSTFPIATICCAIGAKKHAEGEAMI